MVIRTASLREIKKLPKSAYKVVVMRYYPFYFKNLKDYMNEWIPALAPTIALLKLYRMELNKFKDAYPNNIKKANELAWNIVKFDLRFRREILRSSKGMSELRRIIRKSKELKGKRVVYLICCEPTDDYCHRRILLELMTKYSL